MALTVPIPITTSQGDCGKSGLRDGLALSVSSALGALAGFVSWLISARLLPQAEVGNAAEVVSAFILVGGISQLNLGMALMRWLPRAGRNATLLVWRSLLLIMPLAGLLGFVYVLAVPDLAAISAGPGGSFGVGALVFVLACAGWGVFVVHDYILVAIGRPWWSVWRNGLFAVVRIGMLVVLGAALGAQGVVLSWAGPIVVWIVVGSVVLFVPVRRFARATTGGTLPRKADVVGFVGPTAAAQWGNALLLNQVPLLVIVRFGPESGAAFFIVWQATVVLEVAATYFTHALSASWARDPGRGPVLSAECRRRLLVIFLPMLALGALLAEPALAIFGSGYAATADVLRLLLLGQALRLFVVHALAERAAAGRGWAFARLHLSSTFLVILAVILVPVPAEPVAASAALLPVALGYVGAQLACAGYVIVLGAIRRRRPVS
jgi:hypothetical protein